MEQKAPKLPFPLWALALDILGTLILAYGAFLIFSPQVPVPESFRFEHDGYVLMIFGFLLTAPMPYFIIKTGKARNAVQTPGKTESTVN